MSQKPTPASKINVKYKHNGSQKKISKINFFKRDYASQANHGADGNWIFSYADMITILMMFFILMLSISTINKEKFQQIQKSISKADSQNDLKSNQENIVNTEIEKAAESGGDRFAQVFAGVRKLMDSVDKSKLEAEWNKLQELDSLKKSVEKLSQIVEGNSKTGLKGNEFIITTPDIEFFNTEEAALQQQKIKYLLTPKAKEFAQLVVKNISQYNTTSKLRIEVHTGEHEIKPPHKFKNQENSFEETLTKASLLYKLFIQSGAKSPLLSASGYGSSNPVAQEKDIYQKILPDKIQENTRLVFILSRDAK
jgi:chemotaxis protein MotB